MKYILLTLAMALIVMVTSCEHGKVELPSEDTLTDTVDIEETVDIDTTAEDTTDIKDTTSGETTAEVTTVTESSDIPETTEEISTSEPVNPPDELTDIEGFEASSDESTDTTAVESEVKVYVDPIPWEPADELKNAYIESKNITIYYHSGENCVKFELVCNGDREETVLKINDNIVDLSETYNIGLDFLDIYIASEFIVTTSQTYNDCGRLLYIFDHSGKVLFHTFYLSNTGMFVEAIKSVSDDKILIIGDKYYGFEYIVRSSIYMDDGTIRLSGKYSDRLYEGEIYEYSSDVPSLIYLLETASLDDLRKLNPNEVSYAVFELDYLGNGEFGNIEMTSDKITIADEIDYIESHPELYDHSAVSEDNS